MLNSHDDEEEALGEYAVEYINALLDIIGRHQSFLIHKGIDRQEFEDFLKSDPYHTTVH